MNRIILFFAGLLMITTSPMVQVLLVVDEWYKDHDELLPPPEGHKIERYILEVDFYDFKSVEMVVLPREPEPTFETLWTLLRDKYVEYNLMGIPLEGAVLVGDLPVPTFHIFYRSQGGGEWELTAPCEYFLMDLWDNSANPPSVYQDWEFPNGPWERFNGTDILARHNFPTSTYHGDRALEIWVSRIYATNLNYLRAEGTPWGEFLEEYGIIDAYFDKVHKRMTTPVSGTRRAIAIGRPPNFSSLQSMADLDYIFQPANIEYFDNMADLRLNQAAAWQALLQTGRPGNINYGSFQGIPFTDATYERDCRTNLQAGSYEWAAVFAHSSWLFHGFHEYRSGYDAGGGFFSVNNADSWTEKISGGCSNGRYYEWNLPWVPHANAEWSAVIPKNVNGIYAVHMYWDVIPELNSETSYYYMHGNKNFAKINNVAGAQFAGVLDQSVETPDNWHMIDHFFADEYDTLVFVMAPNNAGYTYHNRCVADAVEFRLVYAEEWRPGANYGVGKFVCYRGINYSCIQAHRSQSGWEPYRTPSLWKRDSFKIRVTPGNLAQPWNPNGFNYPVGYFASYNDINYRCLQAHTSQPGWKPPVVPALWQQDNIGPIIPNDLFDITKRGQNGFRLKNWYNRSFCDMQDEAGGQSKVLFFEGIACAICNYYQPDNLGLLYGMGHAGLTMIGNSFYNWSDNDYQVYTEALGQSGGGQIFGKAYLDYANRDFIDDDVRDNFILFGAGTLKESPY